MVQGLRAWSALGAIAASAPESNTDLTYQHTGSLYYFWYYAGHVSVCRTAAAAAKLQTTTVQSVKSTLVLTETEQTTGLMMLIHNDVNILYTVHTCYFLCNIITCLD